MNFWFLGSWFAFLQQDGVKDIVLTKLPCWQACQVYRSQIFPLFVTFSLDQSLAHVQGRLVRSNHRQCKCRTQHISYQGGHLWTDKGLQVEIPSNRGVRFFASLWSIMLLPEFSASICPCALCSYLCACVCFCSCYSSLICHATVPFWSWVCWLAFKTFSLCYTVFLWLGRTIRIQDTQGTGSLEDPL